MTKFYLTNKKNCIWFEWVFISIRKKTRSTVACSHQSHSRLSIDSYSAILFHFTCKPLRILQNHKKSQNSRSGVDSFPVRLHRPAFLKLFQIPSRKVYDCDSFFPAQYEYVNHFLPARPDFQKFYVTDLKITLNSCF